MRVSRAIVFLAFVGGMVGLDVAANEVRYYEQDGVTYRETRQVVHRQVYQTEMRPTTQTVYRQEHVTELRETPRTWWAPVSEHTCEAVLMGRWNPFVEPHVVYRPTTRTRWEARTEIVQTPVTVSRWVPQTQMTEMAVTVQRTVPEEIISRVAVGGPSVPTLAPTIAAAPAPSGALSPIPRPMSTAGPVGGVARLDNDPPRQGASTAWRPSTPMPR